MNQSKNVQVQKSIQNKARLQTATDDQIGPGNLFAQPRRKKKRVPRKANPIQVDSDDEDAAAVAARPKIGLVHDKKAATEFKLGFDFGGSSSSTSSSSSNGATTTSGGGGGGGDFKLGFSFGDSGDKAADILAMIRSRQSS